MLITRIIKVVEQKGVPKKHRIKKKRLQSSIIREKNLTASLKCNDKLGNRQNMRNS